MVKICLMCDKEILVDDKKQMIGIDIPYINVWFHKDCYGTINGLSSFLQNNTDKIYNMIWKERENGRKSIRRSYKNRSRPS